LDEIRQEQSYFFGDATRDAFQVIRSNVWMTVLLICVFSLGMGIVRSIFLNIHFWGSSWVETALTSLMNLSMIIYFVSVTYNHLVDGQQKRPIKQVMKERLVPYFVTMILLGIIFIVLLMSFGFIVMLIGRFIPFGIGAMISSFSILGATIYVIIKLAFMPQAIIIEGTYYVDAFNESKELTKNHGGSVFGIVFFPILLVTLPTLFIKDTSLLHPLFFSTMMAGLSAAGLVYGQSALTALYLNIEKKPLADDITELD